MTAPISAYPGAGAVPPETARDESSRRELQARLAGLGDLNGKKLSPEQKSKKLREACEGFESVFIQKIWQEMRATLPKGGLMQGREEQFWQGMYDQELAKKMSSAGGIGLADMMYAQLSRNLGAAGRQTADAQPLAGSNFVPDAAPLLPASASSSGPASNTAATASPNAAAQAASAAGRLPSIYDGPAPVTDAMHNATAGSAPAAPPEVEAALAALRMQQGAAPSATQDAVQGQARGRIDVLPAGTADAANAAHYANAAIPTGLPGTAVPERRREVSGLELAETARREAGTKLGPNAVRPPLQPVARRPAGGLNAVRGTEGPQAFGGAAVAAHVAGQAAGQAAGLGGSQNLNQVAGQATGQVASQGAASALAAAPGMPFVAPAAPAVTAVAAGNAGPLTAAAVQVAPLPGTPAAVAAAAQNAAQPPQEGAAEAAPVQRVTYTTNVPQRARGKRGQSPIRTLNTDGAGANSKAGAGLAAYHEAQARMRAQAAQENARAAAAAAGTPEAGTVQPVAGAVPGSGAAPAAYPAAAGGVGNAGTTQPAGPAGAQAGSFAVPPLTALDLRG